GARHRAQELVEVVPLDVLHDDEQPVVLAPEVEHLHHVAVGEPPFGPSGLRRCVRGDR
ncbi:MAG: hypothetical protein RLZZ450_6580, partial [Pseudomonadota bacterium]